MNNKTIFIFEDDNYHDNMYTFKLENINLLIELKFCYINIKDNYKEFHFCGFESSCGSIKKNTG